MKKKSIVIILSLIIITVLSSILYVSYGYITSKIEGNSSSKNFANLSQILEFEFSGGTEKLSSIQDGYFVPGSVLTKTFSVKNTGNVPVYFSINLSDIKITKLVKENGVSKEVDTIFERPEDLEYEIYLNDNLIIRDVLPTEDSAIVYNQYINIDETLNYKKSLENQIADQNKQISMNITFENYFNENLVTNIKLLGNSEQKSRVELYDNASCSGEYVNDSGTLITDSTVCLTDYIEVVEGALYLITGKNNDSIARNLRINYYDADYNWIKQDKQSIAAKANISKSIRIATRTSTSTNNSIKYVRISFMANDMSTISFKLNEPSPKTPIEVLSVGDYDEITGKYVIPFNVNGEVTNIYLDKPLRKIGDVADYIDFKERKIYRYIEEYIYDGTYSFSQYATSVGKTYPCIYTSFSVISRDASKSILFSHAKVTNYTVLDGATYGIWPHNNQTYQGYMYWGIIPDADSTLDNKIGLSKAYTAAENQAVFHPWIRNQVSNGTPPKLYYVRKGEPAKEDIELPSIYSINKNDTITFDTLVQPSVVYE